MYLLSSMCRRHLWTITKYHRRIFEQALCRMCSDSLKNACTWQELGRPDLPWSVEDCKLWFVPRCCSRRGLTRFENQRQEVCCAYVDHIRFFPRRGCARSKPQFLTVPSLKLFRLTQVYVWTVCPCSFGSAFWKHCQGKL